MDLEVSYWNESNDQLKAELKLVTESNRLLQAENDQLKSIHGLPHCDLENRWSNRAVRMQNGAR
jgi:FtsZ-binding cell division protein ZapB